MKFASGESAGASCLGGEPGSDTDLFASGLDQVCVPLPPWALRAGARETIYHNPASATAAIVTCGGLCPGLNDVVQGLVYKLTDYGVRPPRILGVRNGFKGFYAKDRKPVRRERGGGGWSWKGGARARASAPTWSLVSLAPPCTPAPRSRGRGR